ncbi:tyrosine-type recombinase/integrase [Selenomonas montiformis]|uniref:tyrosine-type recombinase/integrase n=1 Tax=Selenomonas montiformis TaxID=2652285 RepID=UPI003F8A90F8
MTEYEIVPVYDGDVVDNYYLQTTDFQCAYETLAFMDELKRLRKQSLKTRQNKIVALMYWYEYISTLGKRHDAYFTVHEQLQFIERLEKKENKQRKARIYEVGKSSYEKGLSYKTIQVYISAIREFYNYLCDYRLIKMPAEQIPFRKELKMLPEKRKRQTLPETLTLDEVKTLMAACTTYRDKALIITMVSTGLRIGELCALKMQALDFKNQSINLRRQFLDMETGTLKTGERKLKGNKIMFSMLQRYFLFERNNIAKCENVFVTLKSRKYDKGIPLTDGAIKKLFARLREKTGIQNFHAHILRHTFATLFLSMRKEKGSKVSLPILRNLMGHKNISTTMIYTHIDYSLDELESGKGFEDMMNRTFQDM